MSEITCPTCGDTFTSERGMHVHHSKSHGESLVASDELCEQCGDPTTVYTYEYKQRDHVFCSNDCQRDWEADNGGLGGPESKQQVTVTCTQCESAFEVYPYKADQERLFCNRDCYADWLSENRTGERHHQHLPKSERSGREVECDWCGDPTWVYPSDERLWDHHFCNIDCHMAWQSENYTGEGHPNWRGGVYFRPEWHGEGGVRQEVLERDGWECQVCGRTDEESYEEFGVGLSVHHIIPRRANPEDPSIDDPENLISLCCVCHPKVEHGKIDLQSC